MENETLIQEVEQKVAEVAKTFHAVETKILQEVIDFLVKQPFESVNGILIKLNQNAKPVILTEIPPSQTVQQNIVPATLTTPAETEVPHENQG